MLNSASMKLTEPSQIAAVITGRYRLHTLLGVFDDGIDSSRAQRITGKNRAGKGNAETHQWAGDGNGELGRRRTGFAFDLRHTAKQKQRDARHPDVVATRHQRMRQLMRQQRGEEQQSGGQSRQPGGEWRPVRMPARKHALRQAVDNESEDHRHAQIETDLDTENHEQAQTALSPIRLTTGMALPKVNAPIGALQFVPCDHHSMYL